MRVYRYIAEPYTTADRATLLAQMRLGGDYRRARATIENGRRAAVAALYRADPVLAELEDGLADAMRGDDRATAAAIASALSIRHRERSKSDEHRAGLVAINARGPAIVNATRRSMSARGLHWGTYMLVEDAHDRAANDLLPWDPLVVRGPWDTVGVCVRRADKLLDRDRMLSGEDTRIRLSSAPYALGARPDRVHAEIAPPGWRGKAGNVAPSVWRTISVRVGSAPDRSPLWARLHVRWDDRSTRPLPPGRIAIIKVIRTDTIYRTVVVDGVPRVVPRERWEVQFSVEDEEARSSPTGVGVVGIDIGWRRVPGGVRVAYASGVRGYSECVIPDSVLALRERASAVQAGRDNHLDEIRAEVLRLRGADGCPAWLRDATTHAHQWRRLGPWVHLARTMIAHGHPFGAELADRLRRKDAHLREYAAGLTRRQRLQIRGRVQEWIAGVIDGHDVLGVERTIRIDRMRSRATADSEQARCAAVAHPEVSPGELRVRAIQMARSRGIRVVEVHPAGTTSTCPGCSADRGKCVDLVVTCDACGVSEDQDRTAAREIARRASSEVRGEDGGPLAPSEKAPVRKVRRPRRKQKAEGARNDGGNDA